MSCFGCCPDDDVHKPAESGGQFIAKNSAGNSVGQARAFDQEFIHNYVVRRYYISVQLTFGWYFLKSIWLG